MKDRPEAQLVCDFIRGTLTAEALRARFAEATSPGFDPERDLQRVGLANQTTMLMTESLEIQEMLRSAVRDRWGEAALAERFRAFDTICSATQDRQDAVLKMLEEGGLDVMVVIGGYNSSNTQALGAHLRAAAADLPHQRRRPDPGHGHSPSPRRRARRDRRRGLAAGGRGDGRPDRRRLDPEQRGRRGRRAHPRLRGRNSDELVAGSAVPSGRDRGRLSPGRGEGSAGAADD